MIAVVFKDKVEDYRGKFHGFFQDSEELSDGVLVYPVALVEKDDGRIESVYAPCIELIEEP